MAADEALQPPPAFRSVPGSLFQRRAALTQEIIPDMRVRLRAEIHPSRLADLPGLYDHPDPAILARLVQVAG